MKARCKKFLMLLLAGIALAAQAPAAKAEGRKFSHTDRLVGTDLGKNGLTLSLKPGTAWHTGDVWVVKEDPYGTNLTAIRGTYQVFAPVDKGKPPYVRLYLHRAYGGSKSADITWTALRSYWRPIAVDLEFDAEDGEIPEKLNFTAARAHHIDADNKPTTYRDEPDTVVEKLRGFGAVMNPRPHFCRVGEVLKLSPKDAGKLPYANDLPPGFKLRKAKKSSWLGGQGRFFVRADADGKPDVSALLKGHFGDRKQTFTLVPGKDPLKGTAWGAEEWPGFRCFLRGDYEVVTRKRSTVLRLRMYRSFSGDYRDGAWVWASAKETHPRCTEIEVSGSLPDAATVLENYWVDDDGKRMERYDDPFTAKEKREKKGEAIPVHFPNFYKTGTVVKFVAKEKHPMADGLPPGFPKK